MKQRPQRQVATLFVCTCKRKKKKDCCARFGSEKTLEQLKARIKARRLQHLIRVYPSGCIGKCSKGPNVLSFPDNRWSSRVSAADVDDLLDRLVAEISEERSKDG